MDKPLWIPSPTQIEEANLTDFLGWVNQYFGLTLKTYEDLHKWSVSCTRDFWCSVWDFCGLMTSTEGKRDLKLPQGIFKPRFFEDARLNYAENLLRPGWMIPTLKKEERSRREKFGAEFIAAAQKHAADVA